MGRGVMIALGASLALNFLGAGYFLHHAIHQGPPAPPPEISTRGFDGSGGIARSARYLPDESRDAFRREIRKGLPNMREQFGLIRKQREELRALLAADEYDADAVAAKLAEMRNLREAQHVVFDSAFVNALGAISTEDRKLLLEKAADRQRERRERRRRGPASRN